MNHESARWNLLRPTLTRIKLILIKVEPETTLNSNSNWKYLPHNVVILRSTEVIGSHACITCKFYMLDNNRLSSSKWFQTRNELMQIIARTLSADSLRLQHWNCRASNLSPGRWRETIHGAELNMKAQVYETRDSYLVLNRRAFLECLDGVQISPFGIRFRHIRSIRHKQSHVDTNRAATTTPARKLSQIRGNKLNVHKLGTSHQPVHLFNTIRTNLGTIFCS